MGEAQPRPQYIPEEEANKTKLDHFIEMIDWEEIMKIYERYTGLRLDIQEEKEKMENELAWQRDLINLIQKSEEKLPAEPYNYELYQIRDIIVARAERVIKTSEKFLMLAIESGDDIDISQPDDQKFRNSPLARWLRDLDSEGKKIDNKNPTIKNLDYLLCQKPTKPLDFNKWPKEKQTLWEEFSTDFSEAQDKARDWFEKQGLKFIKPHETDFYDPVVFKEIKTITLDKDSPDYKWKNKIYRTICPGIQFRYRILEKAQVERAELRK